MLIQTFQSRYAYTDKSSLFEYSDIVEYYKGDITLLNTLRVKDFESYILWKSKSLLKSEDHTGFVKSSYLVFPFLKDRDSLTNYISNGVYKLSKDPLTEDSFVEINGLQMDIISRSIDKGMYGLIKSLLPVYTVCYFNDGSKARSNIKGHSGIISIDIDNDLTLEQKSQLVDLKPLSIMPSTSGQLRPTFKIDISDKMIKKFKGDLSMMHEAYFDYFDMELSKFGIKIDAACRNINRLFYISPNTEFNDFYYDIGSTEYTLPKDFAEMRQFKQTKEIKERVFIESEESTSISSPEVLSIVRRELEEIFEMCLENGVQPFYDGSNMYPALRDFHFSLKETLPKEELEMWMCKFLTLSKLDRRLIGTDYINRGLTYIKNEIIK